MTGLSIPLRALRPDGTEAGGAPWHILTLRGWRVEMVPAGRDAV